uniref:Flavin-containing amine oxidase n=1 Tax=Marseillevirus LCMAC201 TaxID=2506605 RepID=A0A481YXA0_9VIRU|nr:MAG: flavin-containing amine oxidase [Marseillevirus LCMAC201]
MKTVAIFGAGISGLSAAHELAEKGWYVQVHEKLDEPGGVARSHRETSTSAPSEYSWRGYAPWYHNVYDLMKRIPINNDKTVYDELSRPVEFVFTKNRDTLFGQLSLKDRARIFFEIARSAVASPKRVAVYATINAADYLKPKMSLKGWKQFTAMFGPWVGIDPQRASLHHVMSFFVKNIIPGSPSPYLHSDKDGVWSSGSCDKWLVFDKPTNEAWFEPWVKHLEKMGVTFHFGSSMQKIEYNNSSLVTSMIVKDNTHNVTKVKVDHYISAISPFEMHDVMKRSGLFDETKQFENLIQDGPHVQVSFRIGFNKMFSWPGIRRAVILSESEFNITMYRQDEFWKHNVSLGHEIKSLWSGTTCVSYKPGSLFGKPIANLTRNQFQREILHQLSKDVGFNDMLHETNKKSFSEMLPNVVHFEVWKSFKFVPNQIINYEPKYVDSTNTRPYQPTTKTLMSNLWLAGGHTKTSTELWSMESAAEGGRRAADMITGSRDTIIQDKGVVLGLCENIDGVLFTLGMPNVIDVFVILVIILIVYAITYRYWHSAVVPIDGGSIVGGWPMDSVHLLTNSRTSRG